MMSTSQEASSRRKHPSTTTKENAPLTVCSRLEQSLGSESNKKSRTDENREGSKDSSLETSQQGTLANGLRMLERPFDNSLNPINRLRCLLTNATSSPSLVQSRLRALLPPPLQTNVHLTQSAIQVVVQTMNCMPYTLGVQREAAFVLKTLLLATPDAPACAEQAVNALVATLRNHSDSALRALVLDLLRCLKSTDMDMRHVAAVVMDVLQGHPDDTSIQQTGLELAASFAANNDSRLVLATAGGLDSFPDTMKRFPDNSMIQCNAAAALCWLVHGAAGHALLHTRHVQTILDSLQANVIDAGIFQNCVSILSGLPVIASNPGTILVVGIGMETHLKSIKVQESCIKWISSLNVSATAGHQAVMSCLETTLAAMRYHVEHAEFQALGCETLASLADSSPAVCERLLDLGAADVVLQSVSRHSGQRTQLGSLRLLALMMNAGNPSQATVTAFGGGVESLLAIWQGLGLVPEMGRRSEAEAL